MEGASPVSSLIWRFFAALALGVALAAGFLCARSYRLAESWSAAYYLNPDDRIIVMMVSERGTIGTDICRNTFEAGQRSKSDAAGVPAFSFRMRAASSIVVQPGGSDRFGHFGFAYLRLRQPAGAIQYRKTLTGGRAATFAMTAPIVGPTATIFVVRDGKADDSTSATLTVGLPAAFCGFAEATAG